MLSVPVRIFRRSIDRRLSSKKRAGGRSERFVPRGAKEATIEVYFKINHSYFVVHTGALVLSVWCLAMSSNKIPAIFCFCADGAVKRANPSKQTKHAGAEEAERGALRATLYLRTNNSR